MKEVNATFETTDTAHNRMDSVVKAVCKIASFSTGITPPTRSNWQAVSPEITRLPHEQKMLRLRIKKNIDTRNALKQERIRLQHTIRRQTLENAFVKLVQLADLTIFNKMTANDSTTVLRCLDLSGSYTANCTSNPEYTTANEEQLWTRYNLKSL